MNKCPDIRIAHANYRAGYNVFIEKTLSPEHIAIAEPIKMKTYSIKDLNMRNIEFPALVLDKTKAQQLMDDLWTCGLRPSEGTGSAGALAAVTRHLEDMRTLVFKGSKK